MTARAIQCPGCGAADSSSPDEHRIYTCSYCGLRYDLPAPTAAATPVVAQPQAKPVAALALGVLGFLIAGGMVAMLAFGGSEDAPPKTAPHEAVRSSAPARPAAEPETPATAEFELHGTRSGHRSSFYVLGFVTNTSAFAIRKPKLTVVLLDEHGKEVGTHQGFADDDVLEPGARSPAKVLVKDPPAHASLAVEVVPYRSTWSAPRVAGLEVELNEPQRSGTQAVALTGRIHHRGTEAAKFVRVRVLAFDGEGKLIGMDGSYADAERLEPGGSARFSISHLAVEGEPARFEAHVVGQSVD
jgi:hypothetical protein